MYFYGMKSTYIRLVVALMSVTLLGLTYIQYRRIANIMALRQELFERHVTEALNVVCDRLEKQELSQGIQDQFLAALKSPEYTIDTVTITTSKPKRKITEQDVARRKMTKNLKPYPSAPSYKKAYISSSEQLRETRREQLRNKYLQAENMQRKTEAAYANMRNRMLNYNVDSLLETDFGRAIVQDGVTIKIRTEGMSPENPQGFFMTFNLSGNLQNPIGSSDKILSDSLYAKKKHTTSKKILKVHSPIQTEPGRVLIFPDAETMMREFYMERLFQPFPQNIRLLSENFSEEYADNELLPRSLCVNHERSAKKNELSSEVKQIVKRKIKDKSRAIDDMFVKLINTKKDIRERVNNKSLDSLLVATFRQRGIEDDFRYVVANKDKNVIIGTKADLDKASFSIDLFPSDPVPSGSKLAILFPQRAGFVFHRDWPMFASSGALTLIVVFCFGYVVSTLFKQKKLSEMKNDFINNMTHEFKTPVSTISLVCEALQEKSVSEDKEKVSRLVKIVSDENKRLAEQVEKVLQTAIIERNDYALKITNININELLKECVDKITVQVQRKGGSIEFTPNANEPTVRADRMHLMNVVMNLLDNANKYSPEIPQITLSVRGTEKMLTIEIKDEGMGMDKDMQRKVFDKFYRVPTGNRHDIKGFGLGLSYVKRIVELHGGNVYVKSELGKGSIFGLRLPLYLSNV